jgi:hypothetical protein
LPATRGVPGGGREGRDTAARREAAALGVARGGRKGRRLGGPAGPRRSVDRRADWAEFKEKNSFGNFNRILEFAKALEICTRRFRRNLDTGIFPKIF